MLGRLQCLCCLPNNAPSPQYLLVAHTVASLSLLQTCYCIRSVIKQCLSTTGLTTDDVLVLLVDTQESIVETFIHGGFDGDATCFHLCVWEDSCCASECRVELCVTCRRIYQCSSYLSLWYLPLVFTHDHNLVLDLPRLATIWIINSTRLLKASPKRVATFRLSDRLL